MDSWTLQRLKPTSGCCASLRLLRHSLICSACFLKRRFKSTQVRVMNKLALIPWLRKEKNSGFSSVYLQQIAGTGLTWPSPPPFNPPLQSLYNIFQWPAVTKKSSSVLLESCVNLISSRLWLIFAVVPQRRADRAAAATSRTPALCCLPCFMHAALLCCPRSARSANTSQDLETK